MDLLAAVLARVLECEFGDARGAFFGDDLDAFDHAGNDFVLQADVLALGVFAHDDQVHAGPMRFQAGKILDGPEVGEEIEFFAQGDVDALEAAADGRGDRALQRDFVALDRFVKRGGDVFAEDFEGLGAGGKALPLPLDAGSFEDANDGLGDFRADAVAGNERDFVRHNSAPGC